ncbi:MAG: class II aldolase/adducin family protein, partial [Pseudomonas capeferrum]
MTVLINERPVTAELQAFIDQVVAEAEAAFTVFRETNTITANGTVG